MTELLPCPFCGGEDLETDHIRTYDVDHPDVYEVHCVECGGRGGEGWTEAEAIAAWNTRAAVTCSECLYCASPNDTLWCAKFGAYRPSEDGFCAWGERRGKE